MKVDGQPRIPLANLASQLEAPISPAPGALAADLPTAVGDRTPADLWAGRAKPGLAHPSSPLKLTRFVDATGRGLIASIARAFSSAAEDPAIPERRAKHGATHQDIGPTELFGEAGPKTTDIQQGVLADCWFLSSLASIAAKDPDAIRDMVRDNRNGTYSVRFYDDTGEPRWITVDDDLVCTKPGNPLFAEAHDSDGDGKRELWVAIFEKAYAVFCSTSSEPGYESLISDHAARALEDITGKPAVAKDVSPPSQYGTDPQWQMLSGANRGDFVTVGSPADNSLPAGIAPAHAYSVLGTEEIDGVKYVVLLNPAAGNGRELTDDGANDGLFRITYADFTRAFAYIDSVDNTPPTFSLPKRVMRG